MEWKYLFKEAVLDRGFDYYERDLVKNIHLNRNFVSSIVMGSVNYEVRIDMEDGHIRDMYCDCPYAQDGNNCKHMAATLFQLDSDLMEGDIEVVDDELEEMVNSADRDTICQFLMEVLEADSNLRNRFKNRISKVDINYYKQLVDDIFMKYVGRHDFIDYYHASPFSYELSQILNCETIDLLECGHYKEAFDLTSYISVELCGVDIDDSDGVISMLMYQIVEIWQRITEQCEMDLKRYMFDWLVGLLYGQSIDYMEEVVEQFLYDNFKESEFLEYKLKLSEQKIDLYQTEESLKWGNFWLEKWVVRRIQLMKEMNMLQEEVDAYIKQHLDLRRVREYYVQDCIKAGEYDYAIKLLEERKEVDKELIGWLKEDSQQLKELYKLAGQMDNYKNEICFLLTIRHAANIDLYRELKTLYTEKEWEIKREEIFSKIPKGAPIDQFYLEDRLYDRLLLYVLDSNSLYDLLRYEKYLRDRYPEELLTKYDQSVRGMAVQSSNRKQYREMVSILRKMQTYSGGLDRVAKIIMDWKVAYRNRPAMLEELKRL